MSMKIIAPGDMDRVKCVRFAHDKVQDPQVTQSCRLSKITSRCRQDFAKDLYVSCRQNEGAARRTLAPTRSTWFSALHAAFHFTPLELVTAPQWIGAITADLLTHRVDRLPCAYRGQLTHRRVVRLTEVSSSVQALQTRPASLKRAAIEAVDRADRPVKRQIIDLGYAVPFERVPSEILEGFDLQIQLFENGDRHYQVARQCGAVPRGCAPRHAIHDRPDLHRLLRDPTVPVQVVASTSVLGSRPGYSRRTSRRACCGFSVHMPSPGSRIAARCSPSPR